MIKSKPHRALYSTTFLYLIFLSIPRILYYIDIGIPPNETLFDVIITIFLGFLRDGLFVSIIFILLYFFSSKLNTLPKKAFISIVVLYCVFLSLSLCLSLTNIQFLRFFGGNFSWAHMDMIRETGQGLKPFLSDFISPQKVAFYFSFSFLSIFLFYFATFLSIELIFRKRHSIWFFILFGVVGLAVGQLQIQNPSKAALIENTLFDVTRSSVFEGFPRGSSNKPLVELLDTMPLKSDQGNDNDWHHFSKEYPLAKATNHHLCVLEIWHGAECEKDSDGDNFTVKQDCNDNNPNIHPDASDIPRNGIDENCNGIDADPPNIIFIHWEGARAVNVGRIGYHIPSTPKYDALTKDGVLFSRGYANATRTRWSLISVYYSILPRLSPYFIFKYKPEVNLLGFPRILQKFGYHTYYIHGGWINHAKKMNLFKKWIDEKYDRTNLPFKKMGKVNPWGVGDEEIFKLSLEKIKNHDKKKPFYMTIATLTNHYPYTIPDPNFKFRPKTKENQIANVMRYSDHHMGNFIKTVLSDPDLENTIILVAGDHGSNWFAPHKGHKLTLWEDLVWVPISLHGKNWNMDTALVDEVRQLADIGPTILDRLGIEVPNHFIGHSLLRNFGERESRAFFGSSVSSVSAGVRDKKYKYFVHFQKRQEFLFDIERDVEENYNLSLEPEFSDIVDMYFEEVTGVYKKHSRLINENRIWNDKLSLPR